ncbi:MAG TPA: NUDIX hydrolase [Ktedonobacterales bacterium]|nr:NUDIX hydrolase [Ktedonobacterales bacterium]
MSTSANERPPDGLVFSGQRFRVRLETRPLPEGGTHQFEIVEAPAAAVIVPILPGEGGGEPRVVLVEQERPPVGQRLLEVPAGLLDGAEAPADTARRELVEETGYAATTLTPLTRFYPSPGIMTETLHLFMATDLARVASGPSDPNEILRVVTLPLGEAIAMARAGRIMDGKTIVGLLLARETLETLRGAARADGPAAQQGGANVQLDPTNAPFGSNDSGGEGGALRLETILSQEFNYANVTAYQANEDRARIFSLYLTLVGVLATALGVAFQFGLQNTPQTRAIFPAIAFLLVFLAGALGSVFFLQLIHLRRAWRESVVTMNRIKEYYIRSLTPSIPDAVDAFRWRLSTIPTGERFGSVPFLICFTVAVLGSLSFGAAVVIGLMALDPLGGLPYFGKLAEGAAFALAGAVALLSLLLHTQYYRNQLSKKREQKQLAAEEAIIGPTTRRKAGARAAQG